MSTQISSPVSSSSSESLLDYSQLTQLVESLTHAKFYSRTHISNMVKAGLFPQKVKISARTTWRKSDVLAWLRDRGVSVPSDVE